MLRGWKKRQPVAEHGNHNNTERVPPEPTTPSVLCNVLAEGHAPLKREPTPLPFATGSRVHLTSTCFTVSDLLTREECDRLIRISESEGFAPAQINAGGGRQVRMDDTRKSGRCMLDSPEFAAMLWQRVRPLVEEEDRPDLPHDGWEVVGLNERLRFLRYTEGEYFKPHQDGMFRRRAQDGESEQSFLTLMLYLNDGARGGETNFLNPRDKTRMTSVVPRTGLGLVFNHELWHEGATVLSGVKYAIRTDVMFRRRRAVPPLVPVTQTGDETVPESSSSTDEALREGEVVGPGVGDALAPLRKVGSIRQQLCDVDQGVAREQLGLQARPGSAPAAPAAPTKPGVVMGGAEGVLMTIEAEPEGEGVLLAIRSK